MTASVQKPHQFVSRIACRMVRREGTEAVPLDLGPDHIPALVWPAPYEQFVGVRPHSVAGRDPLEAVNVELPLEALVLAVVEVPCHYCPFKVRVVMHPEGPALHRPRHDGREALPFTVFEDVMKFPGEGRDAGAAADDPGAGHISFSHCSVAAIAVINSFTCTRIIKLAILEDLMAVLMVMVLHHLVV